MSPKMVNPRETQKKKKKNREPKRYGLGTQKKKNGEAQRYSW